jgi:hypothetical protein
LSSTRLEKGGELNIEGMWRRENKKNVSLQMQKQKKKGTLPPFFAFFFFSMDFFSFLLLEKKKMPRRKRFKQKGRNRRPEAGAKSERAK